MQFRSAFFALFICASSILSAQEQALSINSSVNWETGLIRSRASLDIERSKISMPSGRNTALQKLDMDLPALLKDTFFAIQVDSSEKLGTAVLSGRVSLADITAEIDRGTKSPPWISRDLGEAAMDHHISLHRIGALFIRHTSVWVPPIPLERISTRAWTGIIIDARGALPVHGEFVADHVNPALFPKIWNSGMDLLFERNSVKPLIARSSGVVRYSSSLDERTYRDRIGVDPLRITARGVFGQYRTDPVIAMEDYLRIVTSEANRTLLAEGKIVIILDQEILERSGLGPWRDEHYYFVRDSIERNLGRRPIPDVRFTDSWEGQKITVSNIRFAADSAVILEEEAGRIDVVADALMLAGPRASFRIEGHTASVGKPAGELNLSFERALTIREELIRRGISGDRITATGFGGTRPAADNSSESGRAVNRRVEIFIEYGTDRPSVDGPIQP